MNPSLLCSWEDPGLSVLPLLCWWENCCSLFFRVPLPFDFLVLPNLLLLLLQYEKHFINSVREVPRKIEDLLMCISLPDFAVCRTIAALATKIFLGTIKFPWSRCVNSPFPMETLDRHSSVQSKDNFPLRTVPGLQRRSGRWLKTMSFSLVRNFRIFVCAFILQQNANKYFHYFQSELKFKIYF